MNSTSHKLFAAMFTDQPGEQAAAASRLVALFRSERVHPCDIHLAYGNDLVAKMRRQIEYLENQVETSLRENRFLRTKVGTKHLRAFAKAGNIVNRWDEFEHLLRDRLAGGAPLFRARGWRTTVRDTCKVTDTIIDRWQDGLRLIPEEAFDQIASLTAIVSTGEVVAPKQSGKPRPGGFAWTPESEAEVARRFLNGEPVTKIALAVTAPLSKIEARLREAPPPGLSLPATIPDEMTWLEAWQIGTTLTKKNWQSLILRELGLSKTERPNPGPMPLRAAPERIAALRQRAAGAHPAEQATTQSWHADQPRADGAADHH